MKIVLFGGDGQLGKEVMSRAADLNFSVAAPVASEVDIADAKQVRYLFETLEPEVVINAAAYTAVDDAETSVDIAFRVNAEGPRVISKALTEHPKARLIHISTDYVFDGTKGTPYIETDSPNPLGVYGKSKWEGEQAIVGAIPSRSLILRTASLHGAKGNNIVHTFLKLMRERQEIQVVHDQVSSPTWAGWLADVILDFCRMDTTGIVHASGRGSVSWYGFATRLYELVERELNRSEPLRIVPVPAEEFPRPAPRPAFSAFDTTKLDLLLDRRGITWEEGLCSHLRELGFRCELNKGIAK